MYLNVTDSFKIWARVYFYCIIGVAASLGFLASPGKAYLVKQLKKRSAPKMTRTSSQDSVYAPTLGLPDDPEMEFRELADEVKAEMESRRKKGLPVPSDVNELIKEKSAID